MDSKETNRELNFEKLETLDPNVRRSAMMIEAAKILNDDTTFSNNKDNKILNNVDTTKRINKIWEA